MTVPADCSDRNTSTSLHKWTPLSSMASMTWIPMRLSTWWFRNSCWKRDWKWRWRLRTCLTGKGWVTWRESNSWCRTERWTASTAASSPPSPTTSTVSRTSTTAAAPRTTRSTAFRSESCWLLQIEQVEKHRVRTLILQNSARKAILLEVCLGKNFLEIFFGNPAILRMRNLFGSVSPLYETLCCLSSKDRDRSDMCCHILSS